MKSASLLEEIDVVSRDTCSLQGGGGGGCGPTVSYDTVGPLYYQHFAIFFIQGSKHYMLMNNTKIVIINQMWYQMIRNDERNNFLIEKYFPKMILIPYFVHFFYKTGSKIVNFDQI